jgi:hypothetical protein
MDGDRAPGSANAAITTADGVTVNVGSRVFSHYTMHCHTILTAPDSQGWFYLSREDDTRELLNGERICSLDHARRMGWLKP